MTKYAAFGIKLLRGAVEIAQITDITGPSLSADTEDVTSHDSTNGWEEHVPTVLRSGEITLEIEYDPNLATHKDVAGGLINDLAAKVAQTYTLRYPSSPTVDWSFSAFVTGFEPQAPHDGALTASVTMKPTGDMTLA